MNALARFAVLGSLVLGARCMLGPDYARPDSELPFAYRAEALPPTPASLADQQWWSVFADAQLQALIRRSLEGNPDVRVAAARLLQAEAQVGIARADQLPTLGARAIGLRESGQSQNGIGIALPREFWLLGGSLSWTLDFWGKYRRASEAARARLVASEWGRRAVVTTLVSQVAGAYFALRTLQLQREISLRTLGARRESLRLTRESERAGASGRIDVSQAEQLVHGALVRIDDLGRRIEQQENQIRTLAGDYPAPLLDQLGPWTAPSAPPAVPAGLPSSLLERRPDVRQSEAQLAAANAEIGVAKAAYFPNIGLTGVGGFSSSALGSLIEPDSSIWLAAFNAFEPVYTGGRRSAQVALAEARRDEACIAYQRTVLQAFREVSDALAGYRRNRERREHQALLRRAAQRTRRLTGVRYRAGSAGYLEVLVAEVSLFDAELDLADAVLAELSSLVELYRALGGGWQM